MPLKIAVLFMTNRKLHKGAGMTAEQKKCRAEIVQGLINKAKEEVYKGELDPSLYYSRLSGILSAELIGIYDYMFNTDLDLEKIGGGK